MSKEYITRTIGKKHQIHTHKTVGIENPYSTDFEKFVDQVIWWQGTEKEQCKRGENPDFLLLMIMARSGGFAYDHAKACFGFTDDDFRRALRNSPPGIILYEDEWLAWNEELGVDPPYPPAVLGGLPFLDKNDYFQPEQWRKYKRNGKD